MLPERDKQHLIPGTRLNGAQIALATEGALGLGGSDNASAVRA